MAGLLFGASACSSGNGGSTDATVPATADLVVTAIPSIRWDQTSYTAPAGEIEVALVNNDNVRHDLVILDGDQKVGGLELIAQGKGDVVSDTVTLDPGTYRIFCVVPGHSQMDSELVVE